jgi:hypothetical protein
MHLRITSDSNSESGVGEVVSDVSGPTRRFFVARDYGVGLSGIVVVLMCRDPELRFKRRVRFARKELKLFFDLMLDLDEMTPLEHAERKKIILDRLLDEIPAMVRKYSISAFDEMGFECDLRECFSELA